MGAPRLPSKHMTAKYNVVLASQYKDPTEIIAAHLNEATELMATRVNEATECVATGISHATKRLATHARTIVKPLATEAPAAAYRMEAETAAGWASRMVPSLVIMAWFGLVFVILALTAPQTAPVQQGVERSTAPISRPAGLMPPPAIGAP